MKREEVLKKYSTGCHYISPAAMDYFNSDIPTYYWCRADYEELFIDYITHINNAPFDRCHHNKFDEDGVLRTDDELADEEHEWALIEYRFRIALSKAEKETVGFVI